MNIQAALFDLGDTLTQAASLADALPALAGSSLADDLKLNDAQLSCLGQQVERTIQSLYTENQVDQPDWLDVWQQAEENCGIELSCANTERLARAHLQQFTSQCRVEPYTLPLLRKLQLAQLPTGLISNVTGPADIFDADLQAKGLALFFQTVVWSSAVGCRKPDARIFQRALGSLDTAPGKHVIMIGDNEQADILGGRQMGFTTVRVIRGQKAIPSAADYNLPGTELASLFERLLEA
jgi:putative hydrolase of the HAD superfamily